jgi:hypothetical protein
MNDELEWLKQLAEDPSAAELAAVRAGVLARVSARRPFRWGWLSGAVAAALAVVAVLTWPVSPPAIPVTPKLGPVPRLEQTVFKLGPLPAPVIRRVRRRQPEAVVSVVSTSYGMPVARLRTADPNLVVLWVLNTNSKETSAND